MNYRILWFPIQLPLFVRTPSINLAFGCNSKVMVRSNSHLFKSYVRVDMNSLLSRSFFHTQLSLIIPPPWIQFSLQTGSYYMCFSNMQALNWLTWMKMLRKQIFEYFGEWWLEEYGSIRENIDIDNEAKEMKFFIVDFGCQNIF